LPQLASISAEIVKNNSEENFTCGVTVHSPVTIDYVMPGSPIAAFKLATYRRLGMRRRDRCPSF
jgi:hypothetical protein